MGGGEGDLWQEVYDGILCHKGLKVGRTYFLSPLLVDRVRRFLRFYHLEFDKKAISDG